MKRSKILLIIVISVLCVSFAIFGIFVYTQYTYNWYMPSQQTNTKWYSENPEMYFEIGEKTHGIIKGYLIIDGNKISVQAQFFIDIFAVFPEDIDNIVSVEGALLIGSISKCQRNQCTISISDDHIYNNKYDILILKKVN